MTNRKVTNTFAFSERDIHSKSQAPLSQASLRNGSNRFTPYPKVQPSKKFFSLCISNVSRSNFDCWDGGTRVHSHSSNECFLLADSEIQSSGGKSTKAPSTDASRSTGCARRFLFIQPQIQPALWQVYWWHCEEQGRSSK